MYWGTVCCGSGQYKVNLQEVIQGAGEMAQQCGTQADLIEDWSSVPSTQARQITTEAPGDPLPSLASSVPTVIKIK